MQIISQHFFKKINKVTIVVTLFLIFVGGFVRSSGSGMGCPDWPKCFGRWVPPTNEAQLPENYGEHFVESRVKKNHRFAELLDKLGKHELADKVRGDKSIMEHEPFNAVKTWIEYVNRLVGATLGVLFLITAIASISYWKQRKRITILSVFNVFVVGYQGWLGAIVVSTNLLQWVVTAHMMLAVVLLVILIYNHYKVNTLSIPKYLVNKNTRVIFVLSLISIAALLLQIVFGTSVREELDMIAKSMAYAYREKWVGALGDNFYYHRDMAIFIFVVNVLLVWRLRKDFLKYKIFNILSLSLVSILVLQIGSGIVLSYWSLPALVQPIHLLFSFLLFTVQYYLLLNLSYTKELARKYN